jgi:hypothetical protein
MGGMISKADGIIIGSGGLGAATAPRAGSVFAADAPLELLRRRERSSRVVIGLGGFPHLVTTVDFAYQTGD